MQHKVLIISVFLWTIIILINLNLITLLIKTCPTFTEIIVQLKILYLNYKVKFYCVYQGVCIVYVDLLSYETIFVRLTSFLMLDMLQNAD